MITKFSSVSRSLLHKAEKRWDTARFGVKNSLGMVGTPIILPFRGYGDARQFWCYGRVIEDKGVVAAPHSTSLVRNIWLTLKRYETDEIPGVRIGWRFGSQSGEVVTDEEGYFEFTLEPGDAYVPGRPWHTVKLDLVDSDLTGSLPLGAELFVRTPSEQAKLGVISDIDDTIVITGAWNFMKHWRTVVANSAESRKAFPGLAHFYSALAGGFGGEETNPVFYVSSSPWNLFDLFERFMAIHGIPLGPMLLKDFGLTESKWLTGGHEDHKTIMIDRIMDRFPDLKFILVGDSGQRDADIYRRIALKAPSRVAAVFIREVSGNGEADHMRQLRAVLDSLSIPFASGPDLGRAAHIACEQGWITDADQRSVERAAAEPTWKDTHGKG